MPLVSRRSFIVQAVAVSGAVVLFPGSSTASEKISVTKAYNDAAAGKSLLIDIRRPGEWKQTGVGKHAVAHAWISSVPVVDAASGCSVD